VVKIQQEESNGETGEETDQEDDCCCSSGKASQQPHNFDVDKDELRELSCDGEEEEGLPYEMVFKVNLNSSLSSSSSKRLPHSQSQPTKRARKSSLSSTSTSPTARCSIPHKSRKDTSAERRVLEKLQQDVEGSMFLFESAGGNNNTNNDGIAATNIYNGHKSPVAMMLEEHMVECGGEDGALTNMACDDEFWAQQGFSLTAPQQTPSTIISNSPLSLYLNNTTTTAIGVQDNNNNNTIIPNMGAFMFLSTQPMILAQEERLGRNPYFIRTPPQLRRGESALPPSPGMGMGMGMAMAMEEETSW